MDRVWPRFYAATAATHITGVAENGLYVFLPSENVESDTVEEFSVVGHVTLDNSSQATAVTVSPAISGSPQSVHTNRTARLNTGSAIENVPGDSADDTLIENSSGN